MIAEAKKTIDAMNGRLTSCTVTPGAYEIPLAVQHALRDPLIDAVVALGYIEKGETLHGEVMGYVVHTALMRLQLDHDKPVGFGIIGPGATIVQARKRSAGTARRAVEAVCHMNASQNHR